MRQAKHALCGIILAAAVLDNSLLVAQTERPKPEKVHYYAKKMMPRDWYAQQAELWQIEVGKNPAAGEAWHNYYLAVEYANRNMAAAERNAKLAKILDDMQAAVLGEALPQLYEFLSAQKQKGRLERVFFTETGPTNVAKTLPGLYEFLILKWRNSHDNIKLLEAAYQLNPEDPRTYYDLIVHYELNGEEARSKDFCQRLYRSRDVAAGLLDYNYNVLMSTEKNAILFTNGDNDTFPAWLLQRAKDIRPDVTVLNVHLIRNRDYLKKLLAAKKIKVDLGKLPDQDFFRFVPELCKTLAGENPAVPVYFALTVDKSYTHALANNLYITGLVSRYSPQRLDNFTRLQEHVENNFRLDYLRFDWYHENQIEGESIKELNVNYVASFIMLSEHYEKRGDSKKAGYWKQFAIDLGRAANDQALIDHIQSRK